MSPLLILFLVVLLIAMTVAYNEGQDSVTNANITIPRGNTWAEFCIPPAELADLYPAEVLQQLVATGPANIHDPLRGIFQDALHIRQARDVIAKVNQV